MTADSGAYDWSLGLGRYLLGVVALVVILACAVLLARALRRRLMPGWSGAPALLATGVLAVAALLLAAQLLGLFGLFNLPAYVALLLLATLAANFSLSTANSAVKREKSGGFGARVGSRPLLAAALAVAGVVLLRALWATAGAYDGGMSGFDTHWYHGPFTALFLQTGDTFALNNSIAPPYLSWFYPQNSELWQAIAVLPFERDLLSPALNVFWLAGAMLAAWCIGRPFGVAPLSLIGACLILGSGLMSDQAGEMRNDIPAVCLVLAAAAIAVNAWTGAAASGSGATGAGSRTTTTGGRATGIGSRAAGAELPGRGALAVIGLAAGMAAGTKLNYLATAGALIVALALASPGGRRLRGFGLLFVTAFLGGGYWYVRNLVHSGNPLPWVTSAGPLELPGPSQEIGGREGHGVFEYLLDLGVWRDWFLPGLREALTLAWPLILLGATVATLALLLRPRSSVQENPRGGGFSAPIPLGVALALTILATVAAWLVAPASAEGPAGEPVGFVSGLRYLAPALALALALLPVALARFTAIATPLRSAKLRYSASFAERKGVLGRVAAGLACVIAVAGGYALQRSFLEQRYAEPDFATPGLNRAFAEASRSAPAPDGAPPIAVTSTRIYAFFGPDLKQPVAYVGISEPHGGFRRPETCAEWRSAVNATGAGRLIVAWDRLSPGQPPLPPEAAWIASDPAATQISSGGGTARFALEGKLDPSTCR